ncbi:unnamed protein product [Closterium sp. NIES-54]
MRTYKATSNLYIGQMEQRLTNIRMGEHVLTMEYCNRAQQILADLRMDGVNYLVASYVTHVIKSLPMGYNLMRRTMTLPGVRAQLNEDSLASHIIQNEFMQESERPTELHSQAKYVAPTKQGRQ